MQRAAPRCEYLDGLARPRFYGTSGFISAEAVGLDRMKGGGMIPLLDSQQAGGISNALGRVGGRGSNLAR